MLSTVQQQNHFKPRLAASFKSFTPQDVPKDNLINGMGEDKEKAGVRNLLALETGVYKVNDFQISVENSGIEKNVKINNSNNTEIVSITSNRALNPDTKVQFTKGADGIWPIIKDPKADILVFPGSEVSRNGFKLKTAPSFKGNSKLGFKAGYYPILAYKPQATIDAINETFASAENLMPNNQMIDKELKDNWNVGICGGGFGKRAAVLVGEGENKVAINTAGNLPLAAYSILPAIQAGFDHPKKIDSTKLLIESDPMVGTAGGVIESIRKNKLPKDRNILILPGDAINGGKLRPIIKDFHEHKQAGAMVVVCDVPESEALGKYGIMGIANGNKGEMTSFTEKPKYATEIPADGRYKRGGEMVKGEDGQNKCLASIAIYALKPRLTEALDMLEPIIKEGKITLDPSKQDTEKEGSKGKDYDFGKHVVPTLQVLCNKDIINDQGKIDNDKFTNVLNELQGTHPLKQLRERYMHDSGNEDQKKAVSKMINELNPVMEQITDNTITNKSDKRLKLYAYAINDNWADVGDIQVFHNTSVDIAKGENFKNVVQQAREGFARNVIIDKEKEIVCNGDRAKKGLEDFLGHDGYIKGKAIVMEHK